ncbi:hypothetical protein JNUCC0626_20220 [Lentzea sp. JNUCC 0626]|uniref:hypothetical protein n=1 Tax=Lentzea sp. JNUCC 0626 TaxID=3367513 RepID=UPI00374838D7
MTRIDLADVLDSDAVAKAYDAVEAELGSGETIIGDPAFVPDLAGGHVVWWPTSAGTWATLTQDRELTESEVIPLPTR